MGESGENSTYLNTADTSSDSSDTGNDEEVKGNQNHRLVKDPINFSEILKLFTQSDDDESLSD